ncbi:MAG: biopolymer transporter ExbD [Gammaproteobacteria bacterium]|nr:biopolymer transporter ExbD [Gammaproteobacteria bacterium]
MRAPRRNGPDVNLTPLIDVVFLLLIFFMVSTTFSKQSEIVVELPEASDQPVQEKQAPIDLIIDAAGVYYVNDKQLINTQIETLMRALQDASKNKTDTPLIISADGKASHQSVVMAMDAARQVGLLHLSIATKTAKN